MSALICLAALLAADRSGANEISHVILEVHLDNPNRLTGVIDTLGFELYYVDTLRANDVGSMIIGDPLVQLDDNSITSLSTDQLAFDVGPLPLGQSSVHRQGTCPSECTQSLSAPITVFGQFYHMHNMGQRMITERWASDGTYLGAHPLSPLELPDALRSLRSVRASSNHVASLPRIKSRRRCCGRPDRLLGQRVPGDKSEHVRDQPG